MNTFDIQFYNQYFVSFKNIRLINNFTVNENSKKYESEILLSVSQFEYKLKVEIPFNYPIENLQFLYLNELGFPHQNYDGTICLNTPFVNHIRSRLDIEIERLTKWFLKYVINKENDDDYEYPAIEPVGKITLLFSEDIYLFERFENIKFGIFNYSILNYSNENNKITGFVGYIQNIAKKEIEFSKHYKNKEKFNGIWVLIDKEPLIDRKLRITHWNDLYNLLPKQFEDFFYNFCISSANYKITPQNFETTILICLGYKIPIKFNTFELHWDLITLPRFEFPRKKNIGNSFLRNYDKKINWEKTTNVAYNRFFGRGSISSNLSDKNCLIIGNGAIGSKLAEILIRTGLKKLSLSDFETIQPGNICRSVYNFTSVNNSKTIELISLLQNISPFAEMETVDIKPIPTKSSNYLELINKLNKYDIIFDCSANNAMIQILSESNLKVTIFYISMSDKSKEMLCLNNIDCLNIFERRNQLLYYFGNSKSAEFKEGTGCWHPTFQASYFDINQLLNFIIKRVNNSFEQNKIPKSFYCYYQDDYIGYSEDIKFIQQELNLRLTIENSVIETINQLALEYYPNEFGGCFIGSYIDNFQEVVISDIIIPEKFKHSKMSFVPDNNDLSKKLEEINQIYEGKLEYLGDWHTHPNGSNLFSGADFDSIKIVAYSQFVKIKNPILMIAAFNAEYFEPAFYLYKNDKMYKYKQLIN
jgi:proteasome lid subunit RPN8/RPN11